MSETRCGKIYKSNFITENQCKNLSLIEKYGRPQGMWPKFKLDFPET